MNATISTMNTAPAGALCFPSSIVLDQSVAIAEQSLYFRSGQVVRAAGSKNNRAYMLTYGELIVLRNGVPVELLEPGDVLDEFCWPGATVLARTNCVLNIVDETAHDEFDVWEHENLNPDGVRNLLRAVTAEMAYQ